MSAVVLLLVTVAWAAFCGLAAIIWRRAQDRLDTDRQVFLLHFPPELAFEQVVAFLALRI